MSTQTLALGTTDPLQPVRQHADKVMCLILGLHLLYCLALAPWYDSYSAFLLAGLPAALVPMLLTWRLPGHVATRMIVGACFMVLTALAIHQAHGMIASVKEVSTGNAALSQRTELQASTLQQTAASIGKLTATVQQTQPMQTKRIRWLPALQTWPYAAARWWAKWCRP
jgi:hypothetical protein